MNCCSGLSLFSSYQRHARGSASPIGCARRLPAMNWSAARVRSDRARREATWGGWEGVLLLFYSALLHTAALVVPASAWSRLVVSWVCGRGVFLPRDATWGGWVRFARDKSNPGALLIPSIHSSLALRPKPRTQRAGPEREEWKKRPGRPCSLCASR